MQFFADYHLHSTYSDGRATIRELAETAQAKGLQEIAITDHGPKNILVGVKGPGTYGEIKKEVEEIQPEFPGLKIQVGAEANITGVDGQIDIPKKVYEKLDWLLVGLHPYIIPEDWQTGWSYVLGNQVHRVSESWRQKVINTNTKALVEALYRHEVDVVAHPGLNMPIDAEELARACAATDTAYEINTGHNYQTLADVIRATRHGVKLVVNSDAHFTETVGYFDPGLALLTQARIPPEQVINVRV
ncbi:MAG TPA: PHP domain-containing protein [Clostridia bacterium]|nr:PHP domain-containing protein [Clostridia bacterium]